MRVAVGVPEPRQGIGQVVGVHVEPLPVLDDLMQEHVLLLRLLHPAGNLGKLRFARGMVAAFPGDDLVDAIRLDEADGDRLEDAEPLHRIVEFLLGLGIEPASRLVGIGADAVAGDGEGTAESAAAFKRSGSGGVLRQRQRRRGRERLAGFAAGPLRRASPMRRSTSSKRRAGDAGFRAGRSVEGDGDTVRDGLLIPCQIRDDGVKGKRAEVLAEFRHVTALVAAAALEAGDEVAEQVERRVVASLGRELTAAVTWTMPWAPQSAASSGMMTSVGGAQRREADQGEAGRAVEDEVIVGGANFTEPFCKRKMQVGLLPQPLVGKVVGGEHRARREEVDVRKPRAADEGEGIGLGARIEERLDAGEGTAPAGQQTLRDVALGIGVDDEHALPAFLAHAGQEPGRVRLAHAALEVDDGDGLGATIWRMWARGAW